VLLQPSPIERVELGETLLFVAASLR
jgi:hypothetical protein